jgi:flagellar hook-basal body complex protein FliE
MADPLGFINSTARDRMLRGPGSTAGGGGALGDGVAAGSGSAQSFKDVLRASVDEVNRAQQEATRAVEDLEGGGRTDLEGVVLATQKADNAFRMLQALRNKVVEAYDEIKQMRV